jgi:hypothetical protein
MSDGGQSTHCDHPDGTVAVTRAQSLDDCVDRLLDAREMGLDLFDQKLFAGVERD